MDTAELLRETREAEVIRGMGAVYASIAEAEAAWMNAGGPRCPDGCGECCRGFEPDVLEGEALYLAAWLLDADPARAAELAHGSYAPPPGAPAGTCILYDPASPYHCTVYQGRCLICRLFGYCGDYGKDGGARFRPCRFYPDGPLRDAGMERRQYAGAELAERYGMAPPVMADYMAQALALSPGGTTAPLRASLPRHIRRLIWLRGLRGAEQDGQDGGAAPCR